MEGVLIVNSEALGTAVVLAERLGCLVLSARKPSPQGPCELQVKLSQSAANAVALASLDGDVLFTPPPVA
jgi:hypothetical protein